MIFKIGGIYGKFEDWLLDNARDLDCDGIYSSHDLMKAFIAGSETNKHKCKKCELLNELYDQVQKTDRKYWIWTEIFVMLTEKGYPKHVVSQNGMRYKEFHIWDDKQPCKYNDFKPYDTIENN